MIINPENKGEIGNQLTINMKVAVFGICVSTISLLARKYAITLPFEINPADFANNLSVMTLLFAAIKYGAGKAPLPKEPEQYMIDQAIRLRRDAFAESLTSLVSLVINNSDTILNLIK